MQIFLSLVALLLVGCDPAVRFARVKPDESVEIQQIKAQRPVRADIYRSADKLVEVQVFETGGFGPIAEIRALLKNNRKVPLQVNLSNSYARVSLPDKPVKPRCAKSGIDANKNGCIKEPMLTLNPQQAIEAYWQFSSSIIGAGIDTKLIVPIISADDQTEEIEIKLAYCNPFWGKCETVK